MRASQDTGGGAEGPPQGLGGAGIEGLAGAAVLFVAGAALLSGVGEAGWSGVGEAAGPAAPDRALERDGGGVS